MSKTTFSAPPGKPEIIMTREFDAPRERVYAAYTDARAIPRWWGPSQLTTRVEALEARHGGVWRFVQTDPDGNELGFRGVYHEARAPERIVSTFEFEGVPGHVLLETTTFEDVGGKTRVTAQSVFQSLEDRDGMMSAGAESGARESWERLEELLRS